MIPFNFTTPTPKLRGTAPMTSLTPQPSTRSSMHSQLLPGSTPQAHARSRPVLSRPGRSSFSGVQVCVGEKRRQRLSVRKGARETGQCQCALQGKRAVYADPKQTEAPLDLQKETDLLPEQTEVEYREPLGWRTVREVVEDVQESVQNATLDNVGTAAALSGGAILFMGISSSFLTSLHNLPIFPQVMQTVGFVYLSLVLREMVSKERLKLAPSPLPVLKAMLGTDRKTVLPTSEILSKLPESVDERVGARLMALAEERDKALAQLELLKKKEEDTGRVVKEKDALEAVAIRLAEERDAALSEVAALRTAVNAMTERMKAIEAMLAQEVQRLQDQNNALETVALQLADERDRAVGQVEEVKAAFGKQREEDKKVLEMLAAQLIEERNTALKQVEELNALVGSLVQASGSDSGLPKEMEAFIKSRVRAVRSQFLDITKPYGSQIPAVDSFVAHLVEEYGAPREWTRKYIVEYLTGVTNGLALFEGGGATSPPPPPPQGSTFG